MQKIGKLSKRYYSVGVILILISSFIAIVLTILTLNYLTPQIQPINVWDNSTYLLLIFSVLYSLDDIHLAQARQILKKNNLKKIPNISSSFYIKDDVIYQFIIEDNYVHVIPQKITKEELLSNLHEVES